METEYDVDTIDSFARQTIDDALRQTCASIDFDVTRVVDDGDRAETIVTTAADRDCDHVFIRGEKRSPTGKAIFGDVVQSVLLTATAPVTTLLGGSE